MTIVLFEDNHCHNLYPLGLFDPLYKVSAGSWTLESIVKRLETPVLTVARDHFLLGGERNPSFIEPLKEPVLFLNASVEPDVRYLETLRKVMTASDAFVSTSGNRVTAALVPPGKRFSDVLSTETVSSLLLEMELPLEREMFKTIDWPHEAVDSHLRLYGTNIDTLLSTGMYREHSPGFFAADNVSLAPSAVVETSKGPVVIDRGAAVMHFTYLEGPIHIGEKTRIIEHSSIKDHTSIGCHCKIGGEVEASAIDLYSNKQHHGFLGHSWVGRWVNMGAGTSTSDLKNTYGKVRVDYRGKRIETNMQFLGSVIGDYAKTAVNTSIFTGKIIGVCSMVYGTVTTNVQSFTNYARSFGQVTEISVEQVIKTQERMFLRRDVKQTDRDIQLMRRVFDITRSERIISDEQITF